MTGAPKGLQMVELLTGTTRNLAHVMRFAGFRIHRRESVAEHTCMTSMLAWFIAQQCMLLGSRDVDMGKLLGRALFHDFDEAIMVDLPRPVKYADERMRKQWHALCCRAVQKIGDDIGVSFFHTWLDAKDRSLEGEILALADLISVTSYLIEEIQMGNTIAVPMLTLNVTYLREHYNKTSYSELRALTMDAVRVADNFCPIEEW